MAILIDNVAAVKTRPRHPEKQNRADSPRLEKPTWLRVKAAGSRAYSETLKVVRSHGLHTVCEEAACPNIGSCWEQRHATMMIMGGICTRACAFCNVATGKPLPLDPDEPQRTADAVAELGLNHIVITSVDRDDLDDGGAAHFAATITAIRNASKTVTIEVLTPDFLRKDDNALETVIAARPDVFNHNLETVPSLYPRIRPGARYFHSLRLLQRARELDRNVFTKSGLMLGLGENRDEITQVMDDMRSASVDFLTLGQYLQPTPKHAEIKRYVSPDEFDSLKQVAEAKGFLLVASSPLTRSSHHAGEHFAQLQAARMKRSGASR